MARDATANRANLFNTSIAGSFSEIEALMHLPHLPHLRDGQNWTTRTDNRGYGLRPHSA
jgi:hypothetical protein